jgi:hypothetical protein
VYVIGYGCADVVLFENFTQAACVPGDGHRGPAFGAVAAQVAG